MTARWFRHLLAAAAFSMVLPGVAAASHLDGFVWTFPTPPPLGNLIDGQWTYPGPPQDRSPSSTLSGRYLGNFSKDTLTFMAIDALNILALQADRAYLSFDAILTGGVFDPEDPDFGGFFTVVANGKTLFDSRVAFYDFRHFDLIFDFTPMNPNCCADVEISFSARFDDGYDLIGFPYPTWGIDNFVVSSTPIPEPSTGALLGLGLLLLAATRRHPSSRRL